MDDFVGRDILGFMFVLDCYVREKLFLLVLVFVFWGIFCCSIIVCILSNKEIDG